MDEDLAFCLDRFINDQMKIIDEDLAKITQDELDECDRIEAQKRHSPLTSPSPRNKGSHGEDNAPVDRLIRDLRACDDVEQTTTIVENQTCLDSLRAEILTKIGACTTYLGRLRDSAVRLRRAGKFMRDCDAMIDYCLRPATFDRNFRRLCARLKTTDEKNVGEQIREWWSDAYGSSIAELNRRNEQIDLTDNEEGYTVVWSTSRIIEQGENLIRTRKQVVDKLNAGSTDKDVAYARQWLHDRDEIRNHKEVDSCTWHDRRVFVRTISFVCDLDDERIANVKAECGRKRLAAQAKKLAIAAMLYPHLVEPNDEEEFKRKMKAVVDQQVAGDFAVIVGDIGQPTSKSRSLGVGSIFLLRSLKSIPCKSSFD